MLSQLWGGSGAEQDQLHKDLSVQHVKIKIHKTPCCSPQMVSGLFGGRVHGQRATGAVSANLKHALFPTLYSVLYTEKSSLTHSETLQQRHR